MATLEALLTSWEDMGHNEKIEKLREIRKNKYIVKPALQRRKRSATKKRKSKVDSMLAKMKPEEVAALLQEFQE